MKTVILCGGRGTRMKEETEFKPKPLVLVGNKPILWHIMKIYSHYGFNDFILALGYKGEMIKDYFLNERAFLSDFTLDASNNKLEFHNDHSHNFRITFVETGLESSTGERVLKVKKYLTDEEFMVTYGDGVSNINISKLIDFHRQQKTLGTITGVHTHFKYGMVEIDKDKGLAVEFGQKPLTQHYVNGGFMVFNKGAIDYFDEGALENVFPKLIKENHLSVYQHDGFWKAMDTYREVEELNELWNQEKCPWKIWG